MKAAAHKLLTAALAPKTRHAYQNALTCFSTFRSATRRPNSWPSSPNEVEAFIGYLAVNNFAYTTACTYLSGLAFAHKVRGWPDPTKSFTIGKMLTGLKKLCHRPDRRRPITLITLSSLIQSLTTACISQYEQSLFKAAFLLCFFGLLRVSEFTATSKTSPSPLLTSHCRSSRDRLITILITHSKTDQFHQGHLIKLWRTNDPILCPYAALHNFIHNHRLNKPGPLFIHTDETPLTSYQFSAILQKTASHSGIPRKGLSSHSFRIGACSLASALGVSTQDIKRLGRWSSQAFTSYVRV